MKTKNTKLHNSGSVLLVIFVVTLVLIVFCTMVVQIIKTARRVDGRPYNGGLYTNDESFNIPMDRWDTNFVCWFDTFRHHYVWDDTITDTAFVSRTPAPLANSPSVLGSAIFGSLNGDGSMVLRVLQSTNAESDTGGFTFQDLGMELDENGMPLDFTWTHGVAPTGPAMSFTLQKSSNMIDWDSATDWKVYPAITNYWREPTNAGRMFFRTIKN
jgi:hypothetical protein